MDTEERVSLISAAGNLSIGGDIKQYNSVSHGELILFGNIVRCVPALSLRPLFLSLCLHHLSSISQRNPPGEDVYYHCVMTVQ